MVAKELHVNEVVELFLAFSKLPSTYTLRLPDERFLAPQTKCQLLSDTFVVLLIVMSSGPVPIATYPNLSIPNPKSLSAKEHSDSIIGASCQWFALPPLTFVFIHVQIEKLSLTGLCKVKNPEPLKLN